MPIKLEIFLKSGSQVNWWQFEKQELSDSADGIIGCYNFWEQISSTL